MEIDKISDPTKKDLKLTEGLTDAGISSLPFGVGFAGAARPACNRPGEGG